MRVDPLDSRVCVAGIGTIVLDHVFVAGKDEVYRYHGSRGGGSVWNILVHLSRMGFGTVAYGLHAADAPAIDAVRELTFFGVDVSGLMEAPAKRTLVFTQWLNEHNRHGGADPQDNFSIDCPVCSRLPPHDQQLTFAPELYKPDQSDLQPALVCADRLTPATVAVARSARASGSLSALDLGGAAGLARDMRAKLAEWVGEFDLVSMPTAVAAWLVDDQDSQSPNSLVSKQTAALAITKGEQGFELFLRDADCTLAVEKCAAPAVPQVVDATGAGDAFTAALIRHALGLERSNAERVLRFRANDRDALISELQSTPVSSLGGIGARSSFPEYSERSEWGKRLAALRGQPLNDLRHRYATVRPCYFCALD